MKAYVVRVKGKITKWDTNKGFGFIALNGGGKNVFIHKTALQNKQRVPKTNDIITFSMSKDKDGRNCACEATFSGEKIMSKIKKPRRRFSIYLSIVFLIVITVAYLTDQFPNILLFGYIGLSIITFVCYAIDKSKAKRNSWRTPESTLHILALLGGWPGAAWAQHFLRHKSSKQTFKRSYWITVVINLIALAWLLSLNLEV